MRAFANLAVVGCLIGLVPVAGAIAQVADPAQTLGRGGPGASQPDGAAASPASSPERPEDAQPPGAAGADAERILIDTPVSDVRVNDYLTVATMNRSPASPCPSNQYIIERDRPAWLFQTGRLLQAMKEGATVRISFRCASGYQSINALQFLSPPGPPVRDTMPRRGDLLGAAAPARPPDEPAPRPSAGPTPTETAGEWARPAPVR